MNTDFFCPYCKQPKKNHERAQFLKCDFCGYRSALVDSMTDRMLILDRRMPFLKQRCQELGDQMHGVMLIIDRRIAQDPFGKIDRRLVRGESPVTG